MKAFKKIGAFALAAAMLLAGSVNAYAAGDEGRTVDGSYSDTYSGVNQTEAIGVADGAVIPLTKSIVFVNKNGSPMYEPNITYTYTVEPASIEESTYTVNDETNTGYAHPGVAGGVTGVSIPFGIRLGDQDTTAVTSSADGVEVERTANLGVTLSAFSRPGIYRYKVTETSDPANVMTAGLSERDADEYNSVRYLDVYIKYNDAGNLVMYGAVFFKSLTTNNDGKDNIASSTIKTTGYEPTLSDPSSDKLKDDKTVDQYVTYDFSVKKTVSGSMADKLHEFPFYVSISNSINGARFTYVADGSEQFTGAAVASGVGTLSAANFQIGADSKETSLLKLKANDSITLKGLPSNQTNELAVVVKEFNDTYDKYTPSVEAVNGAITMNSTDEATGDAMAASTGSDTTSSFTVKTNDVANQRITVDNNLTEISPTGVVLRVAPYVLMLMAGIVLFAFSRKRNTVQSNAG